MYIAPPSPLATVIYALILVGIVAVVYFVNVRRSRALKKVADEIVGRRPERLRNVLWDPMLRELSQVVAAEGVVTDPKSAWARISAFAKSEVGPKFQHGIGGYLQQRRRVVDMLEGLGQAGPVPAEVQAERNKLIETSEELLEQVRAAIRSQPPTPPPEADNRNQRVAWKKYEGP